MDFKRYAHHISCINFHFPSESKRNRGVSSGELRSTSAVQDKDSILRIVLASRMVEVYYSSVPAHMVMEKYPYLRLTRPEVFKRPHDSLVGPEEMLFPGQKFYLVPESTFKKLKEKYQEVKADSDEKKEKNMSIKNIRTRQVSLNGWKPSLSTIEELSP